MVEDDNDDLGSVEDAGALVGGASWKTLSAFGIDVQSLTQRVKMFEGDRWCLSGEIDFVNKTTRQLESRMDALELELKSLRRMIVVYQCKTCKAEFDLSGDPVCCPYCAHDDIVLIGIECADNDDNDDLGDSSQPDYIIGIAPGTRVNILSAEEAKGLGLEPMAGDDDETFAYLIGSLQEQVAGLVHRVRVLEGK